MTLETQYVPTEISIRGRTTHWFTYTVQQVVFYLEGFDKEGFPIYAGIQKKRNTIIDEKGKSANWIIAETDVNHQKKIFLVHD